MKECILDPQNREIIVGAVGAAVLLLEYWLGKTDKVRSASIVELLLGGPKKEIPAEKPEQPKE